ncbi:MAG: pyridoxamine 5'-phosphate oxidase family protein [Nitrospinaceae bacterium]|jgi:uncharacterized protein|nr:pyridoxamine 5'-phosphate oxidase family protein [Nitrospinaceae bacterium]MBT3435608.1 pyridoxamine 5'-phosphate oxidase family protein [Nitrospinaceae bacterium]MBT3819996.1 pyridoxamine 5'-phosphate oxidase family protein [Nitrospinaceae bacterium]MBT4092484.1 pyridoxamine 5'-phosphate oxidase family protein [Nitrospinaceae bacterium]MBT4431235.1 pyridoxamine 5'-phosphate oxidase family protein [Nitrospinaceae bacterium]
MKTITTLDELKDLYGEPGAPSLVKEVNHITPHYRALVEASPFVAIATSGPEGLDCSPRGDAPGFVRVHDENTLMLPDRRGNNRTDSLRNIIRDSRVAVLFLIPGSGSILRANGRAQIATDPDLLESFISNGKTPRSVIVVTVETIYFQCAKAIVRSDMWNPDKYIESDALPTAGEILSELSNGSVGGEEYDRTWLDRAKKTMW